MGEHSPLAASVDNIDDSINYFPHVMLGIATCIFLLLGNVLGYDFPLLVAQICLIFLALHRALLSCILFFRKKCPVRLFQHLHSFINFTTSS